MNITHDYFKDCQLDEQRLIAFGFEKNVLTREYRYKTSLVNGQFEWHIVLSANQQEKQIDNKLINPILKTKLIDNTLQEDYTLHLVMNANGEFVATIRQEIEDELQKIINQCGDSQYPHSKQLSEIKDYIESRYQSYPEYLWSHSPDSFIFRCQENQKWFAACLTLNKSKLGLASNESCTIINLRTTQEKIATLVDHNNYFPAFHMNKKHWLTLRLEAAIPLEVIYQLIDESYFSVLPKSKKSTK